MLAAGAEAKRGGAARTKAYFVKLKLPGQAPVRLYAEETGRGAPMLMLHGFGASGYEWRKLVPALSRHHRVITLDLKGFGRSSKPIDKRYAIADQAALVRAFIRRRGLHRITLVGHSFGGGVALMVALDLNARSPGRLSRLILMDSPAYPQAQSTTVDLLAEPGLGEALMAITPAELVAKLGLWTAKNDLKGVTRKDIETYAAPLRQPGGTEALIQTARQIIPRNFKSLIRRYPTIRQPTLLIWCEDDPIVPVASGIRLEKTLPRARLKIIKTCEHAPPEETPAETLELMQRFLRHR